MYIEFQISSLSTQNTTMSTDDEGALTYYGTLFGVAGYWFRLPMSAPPIGEIETGAYAAGNGSGVRLKSSSTLSSLEGVGRTVGLNVAAFRRGDRWIRLAASSPHLASGAKKKYLVVEYVSWNEGIDIQY